MNDTQPNDVLTHHLTAFGDNNLEEILKDYTQQSEILTIDGTVKGLKDIRQFFVDIFILIPTGCDFEMKRLTVTNDVAHIIWSSKSNKAEILLGSDTFVFEDGKIKTHTVVTYIANK